jgi:hypothetical protein
MILPLRIRISGIKQERISLMSDNQNNQTAKEELSEQSKKIYVAPHLTMYGNIEQITQGDVDGPDDGLGGGQSA